jgi:hypothetical protein
MNRRTDTIRVAAFIGGEFGIYTTDPKRLAAFARDLLESGRKLDSLLWESLTRVSRWQ